VEEEATTAEWGKWDDGYDWFFFFARDQQGAQRAKEESKKERVLIGEFGQNYLYTLFP